jgi:hypothetical protein
LDSDDNGLNGTIPAELSVLTTLQAIVLGGVGSTTNRTVPVYQDNSNTTAATNFIHGTLPSALRNLHRLQHLQIHPSQLTGSIPSSYSALSKLQVLSLSGGSLTGEIPRGVYDMVSLQTLHLAGNRLQGTLATDLGRLSQLVDLELEFNDLTGSIPTELGLLRSLEYLGLQGNQLSGPIPMELSTLVNATTINVSLNNNLTGDLTDIFCTTSSQTRVTSDCAGELGSSTFIDCPCCVECCNVQSGTCSLNVESICERDKALFEQPDGPWYQEGAGTICECQSSSFEGSSNYRVNRLSCTDTNCESCNQDGSVCSVNREYGFGYNLQGSWTDFTVTFQYVVGRNDTLTLEKRLMGGGGGSGGSGNSVLFVNGLWCNAIGQATCPTEGRPGRNKSDNNNNNSESLVLLSSSGGGGYYFANCDTMGIGTIDLCEEDFSENNTILTVFALQDPTLLQGCPPRFPPL